MVDKYFVKIKDGYVDCLCSDKPIECNEMCDEYIVRLIKIERDVLEDSVNDISGKMDELSRSIGRTVLCVNKFKRNLRK